MAKRKSAGNTSNGGSSSSSASRECKKKRKAVEKVEEISNGGTVVKEEVEMNGEGDVEEISNGGDDVDSPSVSDRKISRKLVKKEDIGCRFIGDPVPADEAKLRWPHRYPENVFSFLDLVLILFFRFLLFGNSMILINFVFYVLCRLVVEEKE